MLYNRYFGLDVSPFELSPDPRFFCSISKTTATLGSMYYALWKRKGFVVMTGEVGTGKTLLVRFLLELLRRQRIPFVNVFNPTLSAVDFLKYICFDLGIQITDDSKAGLLRALYCYLLSQLQKGLTTVLVIDEAHRMTARALEEVRLLTNLETSQHKLIQIVLVGQPELDSQLDSFELRQLKQRIALRCTLDRFTIVETHKYIEHRLRRAGWKSESEIFPPEAIEAIQHYSLGTPRLINSICDQSLVAAYARQLRSVTPAVIHEVAASFRLETLAEPPKPVVAPAAAEQSEAAKYQLQVVESAKAKPAKIHRGIL